MEGYECEDEEVKDKMRMLSQAAWQEAEKQSNFWGEELSSVVYSEVIKEQNKTIHHISWSSA